MKFFFLFIFFFATILRAEDRNIVCQNEMFAVRKNYEIWLLQNKIIVDDELEEIPLSVLDLLLSIVKVLPIASEIRITTADLLEKSNSIKLNSTLYDTYFLNVYVESLSEYCQRKVDSRLSPIWYFPYNEIHILLNQLYDPQFIHSFFTKQVKLNLSAPEDFAFKRFEANFNNKEVYDLFYIYLKFISFDLFKIRAVSRLQNGIEIKDKLATEYIKDASVIRFADKFFGSDFKNIDFNQFGLAKFEHLEPKAKEQYQALSFDSHFKVLKDAQFLYDSARASVSSDFSIHFDAFVNTPDTLFKTAPSKFNFFNSLLFGSDKHPDIRFEKLVDTLKSKKEQPIQKYIEIRNEAKGDFQRVDFIFNHPLKDVSNQLRDFLNIQIRCGDKLDLSAENKDFIISASRVRVNKIFANEVAELWKKCTEFKIKISRNGREIYNDELLKK
jgi:hypothetical protein